MGGVVCGQVSAIQAHRAGARQRAEGGEEEEEEGGNALKRRTLETKEKRKRERSPSRD